MGLQGHDTSNARLDHPVSSGFHPVSSAGSASASASISDSGRAQAAADRRLRLGDQPFLRRSDALGEAIIERGPQRLGGLAPSPILQPCQRGLVLGPEFTLRVDTGFEGGRVRCWLAASRGRSVPPATRLPAS